MGVGAEPDGSLQENGEDPDERRWHPKMYVAAIGLLPDCFCNSKEK